MADFNLPTESDCVIDIKGQDGSLLGSVDVLDIVRMRQEAIEQSEKLGMDDFWELFLDALERKYAFGIKNKATVMILYSQANDMLTELKKKSTQSLKRSESSDSLEVGE